jgi:C-terminal processing protease CtpA/Prc
LGIVVSENLPVIILRQLGLRPNDLILEIQKIPVLETERLFSELKSDSLSEILLEVQRDAKLRIIRITQ